MSSDEKQTRTEMYLKNLFRIYYQKNVVDPPLSMEKREFGFMFFGSQSMVRHLSFKHPDELQRFLTLKAPSNAFHSAAYYTRPDELRMDDKIWEGCDLIFDIDADHLKTPCKEKHDKWFCRSCEQKGMGKKPEKCTKCGSHELDEKTWLCEECLDEAKKELIKLVEDFLMADFGINSKDMKIFFSGHRGYHVHVTAETLLNLDQNARREIVDYIKGVGIEVLYQGLVEVREGRSKILKGPRVDDDGWRGRLARGVIETLLSINEEENVFQDRKVRNIVRNLLRDRDKVVESLKRGMWDPVKGVRVDFWKYFVNIAIEKVSGKIDEPVTADVRRLIRLPLSLHGKTGFKVCPVPLNEIDNFDPFKHALAFKGEVTVLVKEAPRFRIGEEEYGPFENERVELPLSAAVLLLCKGLAQI